MNLSHNDKMQQNTDKPEYQKKKAFYDGLLTIYGRNPVMEALQDKHIQPFRLHLADSNQESKPIREMQKLARQRQVEIQFHSRDALSRISKNRRQDQGVVLDIKAPGYRSLDTLEALPDTELIVLENVTNPQNVGMIIRAVGASPCRGIILPRKGCASIDALVIKASAGNIFKVPIYYCEHSLEGVKAMKAAGFRVIGLSSHADIALKEIDQGPPTLFVLGNETHGLSQEMLDLCDQQTRIPLNNQVESLNVSIAASIVAFRRIF